MAAHLTVFLLQELGFIPVNQLLNTHLELLQSTLHTVICRMNDLKDCSSQAGCVQPSPTNTAESSCFDARARRHRRARGGEGGDKGGLA